MAACPDAVPCARDGTRPGASGVAVAAERAAGVAVAAECAGARPVTGATGCPGAAACTGVSARSGAPCLAVSDLALAASGFEPGGAGAARTESGAAGFATVPAGMFAANAESAALIESVIAGSTARTSRMCARC